MILTVYCTSKKCSYVLYEVGYDPISRRFILLMSGMDKLLEPLEQILAQENLYDKKEQTWHLISLRSLKCIYKEKKLKTAFKA